jgi:aminoglycoside 3-N-acetyltransferase
MISALSQTRATRVVKRELKRLRHAWLRRWRAFDRDDFLIMLRRLGVVRGDVLFIHSSFDSFIGFAGTISDLIEALQEAVGPQGTLLMPTTPFTCAAVDYVADGKILDVARTPSQMGLVTELFRRSPGVLRSIHPTHPVAVWGAKAKVMIADHHRAATPCGTGTPYLRLLDYGGKLLFLGTGINVMTFYHGLEEILEPQMPVSPLTRKIYHLRTRATDGQLYETATRLFLPGTSCPRNLSKLIPELKSARAWNLARVGGMEAVLLESRAVLNACRQLAVKGIYCYDS